MTRWSLSLWDLNYSDPYTTSVDTNPWGGADLATGLIQLREVEEGCQRASQSLTLATDLRHGVSIDRIRKLERQLPPSHRSPAVRRLREQLVAVASAASPDPGRFVPGGWLGGCVEP